MVAIPLTYCTNVHPGESLAALLGVLAGEVAQVAALVPGQATGAGAFPVGLWWPAPMVAELRADPGARAALAATLRAQRQWIASLNVFPMGGFHEARVKTTVYEPGWEHEERLRYTCDAASVLADLLPAGRGASLSTVPLGFAPAGVTPDRRKMARNLVRAASHLRAVADATGCALVLALEPEPGCLLETVAEAIAFLQDRVFGDGALDVREDVLREHLGLCIDLCHLAVVGEDPVAALAACRRAGVRIGKIQVSSALEARMGGDPDAALAALLQFDEPRYLHQAAGWLLEDRAPSLRALDLTEVGRARDLWRRCRQIRAHFHVPVFWDGDLLLGSTRAQLAGVLGRPDVLDQVPLLEVETYTWGVLPRALWPQSLVAGIAQELRFVQALTAAGA